MKSIPTSPAPTFPGAPARAGSAPIRLFVLLGLLLGACLGLTRPAAAETAIQTYVNDMQPGTNWGNTFDAPYETAWGAPVTTQAMLQGLAAKGYKSLRLPVTWSPHMGVAPDYTIDPAWMDRIQQIVDWALNANLYVMLNMHHDSGWVNAIGHDHDATLDRYEKVWLQIATRFKDYPNKLLFESINEPGFRDASDNDLPDATMAADLDELNTAFVNLVRGTGGNNATRPLVLPSVYTRADQPMIDSLKATITRLNDPNLIATVHYYGYYPFSVNMGGETKFGDLEKYWVDTPFNAVHDTFVAAGIPVIIGEWGLLSGAAEHGEALKYHEYVAQYARQKGVTTMLWDTGGFYDRTTQDWKPANADVAAIIRQGESGRATTSESDLLFLKPGASKQETVINLALNGNTLLSVQDGSTTLIPNADYKLDGNQLTLKPKVLESYFTGAYGLKTTLTINSNVGPAWKIHVYYAAAPVASGLTSVGGAVSIPVAFNGDILATIECKYADGSNAGPVGWSAFPYFGQDFHPDYDNNAIVLSTDFLSGAPATSTINFAFYFWSGKVLTYQMQIQPRTGGSGPDYVIYGDGLADGWNDWTSWTTHNLADTAQVHSGSNALSITFGQWGGVALQNGGTAIDTSGYHTLVFWIHGGTAGGQKIGIGPIRGSTWGPGSLQVPVPVANTWQKVEIPLSDLGVEGSSDISGFYFQDWSGGDQPTVYLDDISLSPAFASTARQITGVASVSTPFSITRSGFSRNRRTNRMVQTVTVRNTSASWVTGPIYLILDSLSANTTLASATGATSTLVPTGSPYVQVTAGSLAPQASVAVTLEFTVPDTGAITYDARAVSGSAP
jgi:aryl-phospho-beta-D-glucosidase BglC (GH1 family)